MEDHHRWFTLLLWVYVVSGYFKIRVLVYLSRWSLSSIFCCRKAWGKEMDAASKRSMLDQFWIQHWNPGEILTNFHVNSYFVAWKLTELDRKNEIWRCSMWASDPDAAVEAHSVKGRFYAHWKAIQGSKLFKVVYDLVRKWIKQIYAWSLRHCSPKCTKLSYIVLQQKLKYNIHEMLKRGVPIKKPI